MEKAVERSVAPTSGGGYSPDFRVAVSRWKLSVRGQRSATPASPQPVSHPAWRNHPPQTATRRFKRQFFGQKSERRIGIGTGGRMSRDEWLTQPTRPEPQGRVMAAPTRKPATRRHGDEAVPFFSLRRRTRRHHRRQPGRRELHRRAVDRQVRLDSRLARQGHGRDADPGRSGGSGQAQGRRLLAGGWRTR